MLPTEERRARLLEEHEIPEVLARALDRVSEAWVVLWVQRELHRLGDPAYWRLFPTDPKDPLWRPHQLRARQAEPHLDYLRSLGLDFDFERGLLSLASEGGRPRSLYSALVAALDSELPRMSREEKIRMMSTLLKPFFGAEWTSTGSKDRLARTFDNV
jgi:hypothetical protein